jgi:cytochrome P450 family 6
MFISESLCSDLIGISVAILAVVLVYYKWTYQYWRRRNLPYLEPRIPFGNNDSPFRQKDYPGMIVKRQYDIMKSKGWKHGGLYTILSPTYQVLDLDYVKNILTKDFQYFTDRGLYYNEKDDPLSAHLFAVGGQKWRNLRTKLTPTFTSGKMKMMFQALLDCEPNLLQKIENDRVAGVPTDIKEALGCFTTDIIGSVAFGLDFNAFAEDNSPFREYGRKIFALSKFTLIKLIVA